MQLEVHVWASDLPLETPHPKALTNVPVAENSSMRLLAESAIHALPLVLQRDPGRGFHLAGARPRGAEGAREARHGQRFQRFIAAFARALGARRGDPEVIGCVGRQAANPRADTATGLVPDPGSDAQATVLP